MNNLIASFKKIPLWRYITAGVLLLGLCYESCYFYSDANIQSTYQDMLLSTSNSVFNLNFIFLLLIADLGFDAHKTGKPGQPFRSFRSHISFAFVLCLLFVLWLAICTLFAMLLNTDTVTFSDTLTNNALYGLEWIDASFASAANLVLVCLSLLFCAAVVFTGNNRCKNKPMGYLGLLAISTLDVTVFTLLFDYQTGFFPAEYENVRTALRVTPNVPLSIAVSVLYWFALIAVTGLIYYFTNNRSKGGQMI